MITQQFDLPILDWIAEHLWCPALDAVMPLVTHLGDGGIFWIALAVILLCLPKYRKTGFAMGAALLLVRLWNWKRYIRTPGLVCLVVMCAVAVVSIGLNLRYDPKRNIIGLIFWI